MLQIVKSPTIEDNLLDVIIIHKGQSVNIALCEVSDQVISDHSFSYCKYIFPSKVVEREKRVNARNFDKINYESFVNMLSNDELTVMII